MNQDTLTGRDGLVVITGASQGIGRALAECYLADGRDVLAIARDTSVIPPRARLATLDADLTRPQAIEDISGRVAESGRPVAILVNNAGVQFEIDFDRASRRGKQAAATIGSEIALNLTAPILLSVALLPHMQRPGGTIVNVTSLLARHPKASAPVYSASKAGLASVTRSMRRQFAPLEIHVVEAAPPLVDTGMTAGRGANKLTPERMAQAIVAGVAARKTLVAPGLARPLLALNRLAPELVGALLARG